MEGKEGREWNKFWLSSVLFICHINSVRWLLLFAVRILVKSRGELINKNNYKVPIRGNKTHL